MHIIASAYPNSALSALTMMVIGFVIAASLAAWLGLVFLADRAPRQPRGRLAIWTKERGAVATGDEGRQHRKAA